MSYIKDHWKTFYCLPFVLLFISASVYGVPDGGAGIQDDTFPGNHTMYAEGYLTDAAQNVAINVAGQNVWVEVDGCVSGDLRFWTQAGCDFTATAGLPETEYLVIWNISFEGALNDDYQGGISINDGMDPACRAAREGVATSYYSHIGGTCIIDITGGDVVKPEMRSISAGPGAATVYQLTMVIHQL